MYRSLLGAPSGVAVVPKKPPAAELTQNAHISQYMGQNAYAFPCFSAIADVIRVMQLHKSYMEGVPNVSLAERIKICFSDVGYFKHAKSMFLSHLIRDIKFPGERAFNAEAKPDS